MKKKIISLAVVVLLAVSYLTVLAVADTGIEAENGVITAELQSVMDSVSATAKIPVSIWTTEIDTAVVEEVALMKSGYNKDSIRALVDQGKIDTVTLEDVDKYIAAERRIYAQMQTQANQAFVNDYAFLKKASAAENAYICSYAPMMIVELTKSQIETLAKDSDVNTITYSPKLNAENTMSTSVPTAGAKYTRDTGGFDGSNGSSTIRIGMVEKGVPNQNNDWISHAMDVAPNLNGVTPTQDTINHATAVAEIMVSNDTRQDGIYKGIVPEASLYCAAFEYSNESFCSAVEWLLSQNVHVINMSAHFTPEEITYIGAYTNIELWLDHIAHNHSIHFVIAAGNYDPDDIVQDPIVSHPALAYNVITVGNLDDKNNTTLVLDTLAATSRYDEIKFASSVTPANKPDLVAPGENISTSSFPNALAGLEPVSGTSFAAPHVTGIVAQLIQQMPALATLQDLTKAILTAAISHPSRRYTSADEIDFDKYGAGCVNATACTEVSYRGTFASSTFPASNTTPKTYTFYAPTSASFVRASLVWLKSTWYSGSNHSGYPSTSAGIAGLRITITTPNGQILSFPGDGRTNMIVLELDTTTYGQGNYIVKIETNASSLPTYFGLAWWY